MNLIDIVVLLAVGFGAFRGFRNGVIHEVFGLLGLVVGIWAGMRLAFIFANYYRDNFEIPENFLPLLAFLTAFAIGIGIFILAGKVATMVVKTVQLGLVNRAAGAVFGGLKFAFLVGTLLSMIGNSQVITEETKEGSATYPILNAYCQGVQDYSIGLLPFAKNVFGEMEDYFTDLDSIRQENKGTPPEGSPDSPDSTPDNPDSPPTRTPGPNVGG
ncbi:MAG: CvpA family protein [Bacteroidota bacterium]